MWNNVSNSFLLQQCRQRRYTFITVISLAIILISFFITYASFSVPKALSSLKQINVVFRHGDKTPTYSYPNDPHKDYVWPEGKGALTKQGKKTMFDLGAMLRTKYDHFLGPIYNPDEVVMTSSYAPRVQMSAAAFLAGMFPPTGFQLWNEKLLWQPIPVNPIPRKMDNLIAAKAPCTRFNIEKKRSDAELEKNLSEDRKELLAFLTEKTGDRINNISRAEALYYTLKIQAENKLDLPAWYYAMTPAKLANLAGLNLASYTQTDTLKKLQSGPLLAEITNNMKNYGVTKRKANFYAGHDLTIVSLMRTLGFDGLDLPGYGATLVFEYHENDDDLENAFVQLIYYRGATDQKPNNYNFPFCDVTCRFKTFFDGVVKYIPKNWQAECEN